MMDETYFSNHRVLAYIAIVIVILAMSFQQSRAENHFLSATATSTPPVINDPSYTNATSTPITFRKKEPERILSKEYICEKKNNKAASTFKVCNEEIEVITITSFTAGAREHVFAELLVPHLPIILNPGACRTFVIQAGRNIQYSCSGFFDVILNIESESFKGTVAIGL